MGDVEVVIDCRTCYRLQNCGGRYYCPFAGLQPCFRGIHTTHVPAGKISGIDYVAEVVEKNKPGCRTNCKWCTYKGYR